MFSVRRRRWNEKTKNLRISAAQTLTFFWKTLSRCAPEFWRQNSHTHEKWIRVCPRKRLPLSLKKSIDHQGASFKRCSPSAPRCFAADHRRAGINCQQSAIGQRYFAAVRNPARIHGAMSGPQSRAGGTDVPPRPAIGTATSTGPINRDSCEHGLLVGENGGSQEQDQSNSYDESFHFGSTIPWRSSRSNSLLMAKASRMSSLEIRSWVGRWPSMNRIPSRHSRLRVRMSADVEQ
jgi:hypothetical protein